jgi:hypothetical protein
MHVAYTNPGGLAAFDLVRNAPGVQIVADIGTDAVYDPSTATLYVAKGDALVAIKAGTSNQTDAARLALEKPFGRLVAGRI